MRSSSEVSFGQQRSSANLRKQEDELNPPVCGVSPIAPFGDHGDGADDLPIGRLDDPVTCEVRIIDAGSYGCVHVCADNITQGILEIRDLDSAKIS